MPTVATKKTKALTAAATKIRHARYVLRLYVAGMTPRSREAITRVTALCDEHLAGRYELEIVDIYQRPSLAKGEQIVAVPTLIKQLPEPLRRFIGDMQSEEKLLFGLDIVPAQKAAKP